MSYPHGFKVLIKNPGQLFIAGILETFQLEFIRWRGTPYPAKVSPCQHARPAAEGSLRKGYIKNRNQYCPRCYPDGKPLSLEWTEAMIMLEIGPGDHRFTEFHDLYEQFTQQEMQNGS